MPFGRFRGTPITDLPSWYLRWLDNLPDLRDPLASAVRVEVERRRVILPAQVRPLLRKDLVDLAVRLLGGVGDEHELVGVLVLVRHEQRKLLRVEREERIAPEPSIVQQVQQVARNVTEVIHEIPADDLDVPTFLRRQAQKA